EISMNAQYCRGYSFARLNRALSVSHVLQRLNRAASTSPVSPLNLRALFFAALIFAFPGLAHPAVPLAGVQAVAGGQFHTCAVVDAGVQGWGDGSAGKRGNGSTADSSVPVVALAGGSGATAIGGGSAHSCAVVNGGVQCWGSDSSGQLGNGGANTNSAVPVTA